MNVILIALRASVAMLASILAHMSFSALGYGPITRYMSAGFFLTAISRLGLSVLIINYFELERYKKRWWIQVCLLLDLCGTVSLCVGLYRLLAVANGWWPLPFLRTRK